MGSGSKLQRQKKGPWRLGEKRQEYTHLGRRRQEPALGVVLQRERVHAGERRGWGKAPVCLREALWVLQPKSF